MSTINFFEQITRDEVTIITDKSSYESNELQSTNIVINNETRAVDLSLIDSLDTVYIKTNKPVDLTFTISAVDTVIQVNGKFEFQPTATFLATLDSLTITESNLEDTEVSIVLIGKE